MDTLARLQQWYSAHCDGEWEHVSGITIQTLDNPGWMIAIELDGTELLGRPFTSIEEGTGNDGGPAGPRWIACFVRERKWQGAADETQLERLLSTFLEWAEQSAH